MLRGNVSYSLSIKQEFMKDGSKGQGVTHLTDWKNEDNAQTQE